MLQQFAGRRVLACIIWIDHQRIDFAARLVVVEDIFFGDDEGALGGTGLTNRGFRPGLVVFPPRHEIFWKVPLLFGFDEFI